MGFVDSPIINSLFEEPAWQYQLDDGQPTGLKLPGRRASIQIVPVPAARRRMQQGALDLGDVPIQVKENCLVNEIRGRLALWRKTPGSKKGVTPETLRRLAHWSRPDRVWKLFYWQREALKTLIYLTEFERDRFRPQIGEANDEANPGLLRLASKMATGSAKTTVMAMIIASHARCGSCGCSWPPWRASPV